MHLIYYQSPCHKAAKATSASTKSNRVLHFNMHNFTHISTKLSNTCKCPTHSIHLNYISRGSLEWIISLLIKDPANCKAILLTFKLVFALSKKCTLVIRIKKSLIYETNF